MGGPAVKEWHGKKPRVIHYPNSLLTFAQVFGIALHEVYIEVQLHHYMMFHYIIIVTFVVIYNWFSKFGNLVRIG